MNINKFEGKKKRKPPAVRVYNIVTRIEKLCTQNFTRRVRDDVVCAKDGTSRCTVVLLLYDQHADDECTCT